MEDLVGLGLGDGICLRFRRWDFFLFKMTDVIFYVVCYFVLFL